MLSKIEAKRKVEKLVKKFDNLSTSQLKKYNEANTRKDFILPLFHALGWDVYNDISSNEVVEEEPTISGRIDYSFRLNNLTQFLLEAKAIPENLDKEKWAHQAIEYGWNKGISWVVLTDFEGLKVFNSDWKVDSPRPNLVLDYNEYLKRFEDLWLLSRESIEKGELNEHAKKWGITAKRVSVNERLAEDLVKWRDILTNNLKQWNKDITESDLEEAIQRILDRLIFIRVVEDRRIEDKILWQTYQKWETKGRKPYNFIKALTPIFRDFDKKYNSNLFQKHLCEDLDTEGEPFREIIPQLYGEKEQGVKYRFDAIDADVLGGVYEQYLGKVQQREGAVSKRKKQGIYYTPNYIVEYIVQNTLGKLLEETPSLAEREKIKILDPACGSGSFLIKAFEVMDENLRKERKQNALRKYRILTENIYGVDLDEQAVEIARLNLLLKALVPGQKLPLLTEHMKVGNSLISGKEKALKKYFGAKWREKNPFNWKEEYFDDIKRGGFDVIVGNPPYIRPEKVSKDEREYYLHSGSYEHTFGRFDIYILFIEKALKLLKNGGYFAFIIPASFLNQNYSKLLRKWILTSFTVQKILDLSDLKVFKSATVQTAVLVIKKQLPKKDHLVEILRPTSLLSFKETEEFTQIPQQIFLKLPQFMMRTDINNKILSLIKKVKARSISLNEISYVVIGAVPHHSETGASKDRLISTKKSRSSQKKYIEGKDLSRYTIKWRNIYLDYKPDVMHRPKFPELFENRKLVVRNISTSEGLIATLDDKRYFANDTVSLCVPWYLLRKVSARGTRGTAKQLKNSESYRLSYLLGLINSRLLNFYFQKMLSSTLHVYPEAIRQLPIYEIGSDDKKEREKQNKLSVKVRKMIELHNELNTRSENSDRWVLLKKQIKKLDSEINQLVYKLYNLTPEEIEVVEKS